MNSRISGLSIHDSEEQETVEQQPTAVQEELLVFDDETENINGSQSTNLQNLISHSDDAPSLIDIN